jgi:hypothetical protein
MPAQANSSQDPISKKPKQKGLMEWLKVKALSSSPGTTKKKLFTHGEADQQLDFTEQVCCKGLSCTGQVSGILRNPLK